MNKENDCRCVQRTVRSIKLRNLVTGMIYAKRERNRLIYFWINRISMKVYERKSKKIIIEDSCLLYYNEGVLYSKSIPR